MDITTYIKPELLVLVPVLIIIGAVIKHYTQTDNRWIPLVLTGIGVVLSTIWVLGDMPIIAWQDVTTAILTAVVQGVLVAGAAVYGNQVYKQLSNNKEDK